MKRFPTWASRSVIASVVLFSPALAFLVVTAAEILIDLLMEAGVTALFVVAAGAIGWLLFRKMSPRTKVAPLATDDEGTPLGEPAIAAPST